MFKVFEPNFLVVGPDRSIQLANKLKKTLQGSDGSDGSAPELLRFRWGTRTSRVCGGSLWLFWRQTWEIASNCWKVIVLNTSWHKKNCTRLLKQSLKAICCKSCACKLLIIRAHSTALLTPNSCQPSLLCWTSELLPNHPHVVVKSGTTTGAVMKDFPLVAL